MDISVGEQINNFKPDIIKSVQEIVKIKSFKSMNDDKISKAPYGNGINEALLYALDLSSKLGFKTKNIDGYIGYAEYGEGDEIVGVLGNLDTAPEREGWLYQPYAADIHNNKIYGYGSLYNKGPLIAALYGLKAIKDLGIKLNKRVRIIFGTDKNGDWEDINYYTKNEQLPNLGFTTDGKFPVVNSEKGFIEIEFKKEITRKSKGMISIKKLEGGQGSNIVPSECYCKLKLKDMAKLMLKDTLELYCQKNNINMHIQEEDNDLYTINSRGLSSLGSEPDNGKNAITQLIVFLNQFNLGQNDVSDFIKFLSNYIGEETDGKSLNIAYEEENMGNITVNLGAISIDDNIAKCIVGITYPIGADYEDILRNILTITADKKIDVSILNNRRPLYIDEDSFLINTLLASYKKITGEDGFTISLGEQTLAKAFENMVSFGPVFPGEDGRNFMTDEYIGIDELIKCTKIYADAIYKLAK